MEDSRSRGGSEGLLAVVEPAYPLCTPGNPDIQRGILDDLCHSVHDLT